MGWNPFKSIKKAFKSVGNAFKNAFNSIKNAAQKLVDNVMKTINNLKNMVTNLGKAAGHLVTLDFGRALKDLEKASDAATKTVQSITDTVQTLATTAVDLAMTPNKLVADMVIDTLGDMGLKSVAKLAKKIENSVIDATKKTVDGFLDAAGNVVESSVSFYGNMATGKFGKAVDSLTDLATNTVEVASYLSLSGAAANYSANFACEMGLDENSIGGRVVLAGLNGKRGLKDLGKELLMEEGGKLIEKSPVGDTEAGRFASSALKSGDPKQYAKDEAECRARDELNERTGGFGDDLPTDRPYSGSSEDYSSRAGSTRRNGKNRTRDNDDRRSDDKRNEDRQPDNRRPDDKRTDDKRDDRRANDSPSDRRAADTEQSGDPERSPRSKAREYTDGMFYDLRTKLQSDDLINEALRELLKDVQRKGGHPNERMSMEERERNQRRLTQPA